MGRPALAGMMLRLSEPYRPDPNDDCAWAKPYIGDALAEVGNVLTPGEHDAEIDALMSKLGG